MTFVSVTLPSGMVLNMTDEHFETIVLPIVAVVSMVVVVLDLFFWRAV